MGPLSTPAFGHLATSTCFSTPTGAIWGCARSSGTLRRLPEIAERVSQSTVHADLYGCHPDHHRSRHQVHHRVGGVVGKAEDKGDLMREEGPNARQRTGYRGEEEIQHGP